MDVKCVGIADDAARKNQGAGGRIAEVVVRACDVRMVNPLFSARQRAPFQARELRHQLAAVEQPHAPRRKQGKAIPIDRRPINLGVRIFDAAAPEGVHHPAGRIPVGRPLSAAHIG